MKRYRVFTTLFIWQDGDSSRKVLTRAELHATHIVEEAKEIATEKRCAVLDTTTDLIWTPAGGWVKREIDLEGKVFEHKQEAPTT